MKSLPVTKIPDNELKLIIEDGCFNYGAEAIICHSQSPNTCYKLFHQSGSMIRTTAMTENKERKIVQLYNNPIPGLITPMSLVSNNGQVIGYEMPYDSNCGSIFDMCLTTEERIECLYQTAQILKGLVDFDCVYGDIKSDNILYNPTSKTFTFCDVDNIKLGQYPIDIYGAGIDMYMGSGGMVDAKADAFTHNLLTLEQLFYNEESFCEIMKQIINDNLYPELSEDAKRIISSMKNPREFTGEYVLEYIKKRG